MNYLLKKNPDSNQLDELVLGLVNNMPYSNPNILYPKEKNIHPDDGVSPEWLYPALEGTLTAPSEQSAVYQYIKHSALYPAIGQLCLGIAITEMKHLDKIGDTILALGGTIHSQWNNSEIDYGTDIKSALIADIQSEKTSIDFYSSMIEKLSHIQSNTAQTIAELLSKIKADEEHHLYLLEKVIQNYNQIKS
ncbi:MAG: ferritin-like domain-containing protein [Flavobacteriales bacterium]|nr:ferritin-like domain-containing protein [Flavobacteriales bacterium]